MIREHGKEIEYKHHIRGTVLNGVVRESPSMRVLFEQSLE